MLDKTRGHNVPNTTPNPNANMIRTVIGGVLTSVLGAVVLFFLGINKTGGNASAGNMKASFLEVKEATLKGWKSYVADDNIFFKNTTTIYNELVQNRQLDNYLNNSVKEISKQNEDLESILKDDMMDNSLRTLLKRRLDVNKDLESRFKDYVANLKAILNNNSITQEQRQQKLAEEDQSWLIINKGMSDRHATELVDLSKVLNEKYGNSFSPDDFLTYQSYKKESQTDNNFGNNDQANTVNPTPVQNNPSSIPANPISSNKANDNSKSGTSVTSASYTNSKQNAGMFAGEWQNEAGYLSFDNNGFEWEWNDGSPTSYGSWAAQNNQMVFYVTKGEYSGTSWIFNLMNVTPSSFTIQLTTNPGFKYNCVKYK